MSEETFYQVLPALDPLLWWNGLCGWVAHGEIRSGDGIAAKSAGHNRGKQWILCVTSSRPACGGHLPPPRLARPRSRARDTAGMRALIVQIETRSGKPGFCYASSRYPQILTRPLNGNP